MESSRHTQYISSAEVAALLGISRVAVFKKIKKGEIKATKVGRNYIIDRDDILALTENALQGKEKQDIDMAIKKTVDEYGETIRLLGKE